MSTVERELAGRAFVAVAALGGVLGCRRREVLPRRIGRRRAATLAVGVPAAVVLATTRPGVRVRTRSAAGHGLLLSWVLAGAVTEEVLWRWPLLRTGRRAGPAAVGGIIAFAAMHAARDGVRGGGVQLLNATGWTLATLANRSIFWPVVGHTLFNFTARTLAPAGPAATRAGGTE